MIEHSDVLAPRAERRNVADRARPEGEAKGWRDAATTLRTS